VSGPELLEEELFGTAINRSRGFFCGPWWISRQHLHAWRSLQATFQSIGISSVPSRIEAVLAWLFKTGPQPLHADAVVAKTHLRAFYLARGLTLKFAGKTADDLRNEIVVRSSIVETDKVKVPRIHRSSVDAKTFILEEIIWGGSKPLENDLTPELIASLWEFYTVNTLTATPLCRFIDAESLDSDLGPALSELHVQSGEIQQVWKKLKSEIDWEQPVPVGLCHGDLNASNILFRAGSIFLLDWEHGHKGLILNDWAKLSIKFPEVVRFLQPLYDQWLPQGTQVAKLSNLFAVCLLHLFVAGSKSHNESKNRLMRRLRRAQTALART
jgi:hypothetical protein